jgi:THO complex subunit 4
MSQHRTHQRGGRRAAGSGGGRRGKERSKPKSTEELDADLEKYHADAMQTN